MTTFYIDANNANSLTQTSESNEWVYRLNEPLNLPAGSLIQIQTSFINLKGVTGGSIEIKDTIVEEFNYVFYITEQGHPTPMATPPSAHHRGDNSWFRTTLNISRDSFQLNFDKAGEINNGAIDCLHSGGINAQEQQDNHYNYFHDTGGSNMILPCVNVEPQTGGDTLDHFVVRPLIMHATVVIPKGIYGIGQLGQLIEDQINGARANDPTSGEVEEYGINEVNIRNGAFDGDLAASELAGISAPCFSRVVCQKRAFDVGASDYAGTHMRGTAPNDKSFQMFVNMNSFNDLMDFAKRVNGDPTTPSADTAPYLYNNYKTSDPMYCFMVNYDDGAGGAVADPMRDQLGYNLYGRRDVPQQNQQNEVPQRPTWGASPMTPKRTGS